MRLKKIIFILFLSTIIYSNYIYLSLYDTRTIDIDGKLSEDIWNHITPVQLKEYNSNFYPKYNKTYVKCFFNDTCIYIGYLCYDTDIWAILNKHDDSLFTEEVVELFIQPDPNDTKYIELEISPANIVFDAYINYSNSIDFNTAKKFNMTNWTHNVFINGTINNNTDIDTSWSVEIALNYKNIKLFNNPLTEMRVNFYRIERNYYSKLEQDYAWSPTYAWFHTPSRFGRIKFIRK